MAQGSSRFRFDVLLLVVAVLGIAAGGGGLYYNDTIEQRHSNWIAMAEQLQTDSLAVSRIADDVGRGLSPDFAELTGQSENFADSIRILREGDADAGIDAMPALVRPEVGSVEQAWATMKQSMERLTGAEAAVSTAIATAREIDEGGVAVFALYREASARLVAGAAGVERLAPAGEQMARAERLRTLSRQLLGDGRDAAAIAKKISEETAALGATHAQLAGEGPVGTYLSENNAPIEALAAAGAKLAEVGPALSEMQTAAGVLPGDGRNLYSAAATLQDALTPLGGEDGFQRSVILPALAVAVGALLLYVLINIIQVRRRIRRAEENDRKQQAAILSLLDEISTLADGDLTVRANVTGDFTGAIADSVNSTVDTLRGLVSTINRTAVELSAAANATQLTAGAMETASDTQAQNVVQIAAQVSHSSDSLSAVAARAEQLSQQAGNSVDVAHNGAATVSRTIQGMAALREQIQDTAKRIKRLGESSQEIGNIIEFINDIAEQTNTLALNASIQAAMAGESGRGFAVVADEVQRLAERAATATRQIETLVKTIQADTNEAIVSMERSTTNVVSGARSAEEAGAALTRIEATSTDLARLIQNISAEARTEAAQATRIAGQMQAIRNTALQTAESAQKTAREVDDVNQLSAKLRESVAGFRLPAQDQLDMAGLDPV